MLPLCVSVSHCLQLKPIFPLNDENTDDPNQDFTGWRSWSAHRYQIEENDGKYNRHENVPIISLFLFLCLTKIYTSTWTFIYFIYFSIANLSVKVHHLLAIFTFQYCAIWETHHAGLINICTALFWFAAIVCTEQQVVMYHQIYN